MNDFFSLEFILPTLLLIFLIDLEIKAKKLNKTRIIAMTFIYIAFLLLWIKPSFPTEARRNHALLITPNHNDSLFNDLRTKDPDSKVFALKQSNNSIAKDSHYEHLYDLLQKNPALNAFTVLGEGLENDERKLIKDFDVEYHALHIQEGILSNNYKQQISQNEQFDLSGFVVTKQKNAKLYLTLFGQKIDSITKLNAGKNAFRFTKKMKAPAQVLFQLELQNKNQEIIERNTLPVNVKSNPVYAILMISKQANTEINQLKNYIKSQGHALFIRTGLSKNVYKYETLNTTKKNWTSLSSELLNIQDLVIIDSETYNLLKASDQRALISAVENNGLGLFIFQSANEIPKIELIKKNFKVQTIDEKSFEIGNADLVKKSEILVDKIFQKRRTNGIAIIDNLLYQIQSSSGKYTISSLSNSYILKFKGETENYNAYWEKIIFLTAKHPKKTIHLKNYFAYENIETSFETSTNTISILKSNKMKIPKRRLQYQHDSNLYNVQFIPKEFGWYTIEYPEGKSEFYVHQKNDLKTIRQIEKSNQTQLYFSKDMSDKHLREKTAPINSIWAYLLLLFGLGILWFLDKK